VVRNLEACSSLYDTEGILLATEYEFRLRKSGERVVLHGAVGEPAADFHYDDAWSIAETYGKGHYLMIAEAFGPLARLGRG